MFLLNGQIKLIDAIDGDRQKREQIIDKTNGQDRHGSNPREGVTFPTPK